MVRLAMENYNTTLIDKQPKYQLYHHVKFTNMNVSLVMIYFNLINDK